MTNVEAKTIQPEGEEIRLSAEQITHMAILSREIEGNVIKQTVLYKCWNGTVVWGEIARNIDDIREEVDSRDIKLSVLSEEEAQAWNLHALEEEYRGKAFWQPFNQHPSVSPIEQSLKDDYCAWSDLLYNKGRREKTTVRVLDSD